MPPDSRRVTLFGGVAMPLGVVVVFGAFFLLFVLSTAVRLLVLGVGGDGDGEARPNANASRATTTTVITTPAVRQVTSPVLGPVVVVRPTAEGPSAPVGGLRPDTVVQMRAIEFPPFADGTAYQCARVCGNPLPVQMNEAGEASFQYLVVDDFADSGCRVDAAPCSIVIAMADDPPDKPAAVVRTLFIDELPEPVRLRVSPSTGLNEGDSVRVEVEGLPPGASARLLLCARECDMTGTHVVVQASSGGTAFTDLTLTSDRIECTRGSSCAVSIVSDDAFVQAVPTPISFRTPPGVDYSTGRLAAGLAAAIVLLGAAAWLIRRSDWGPVGEEAAPEIDDAEYADLDAIVAALPPEPTLDELVAAQAQR